MRIFSPQRTRLDIAYPSDDGVDVLSGRFYDTKLDRSCTFSPAQGDVMRCCPVEVAPGERFGPYYATRACKDEAFEIRGDDGKDAPYIAYAGPDGCGPHAMYEIGARTTEDVYQGPDCTLRPGCHSTKVGASQYRFGPRINGKVTFTSTMEWHCWDIVAEIPPCGETRFVLTVQLYSSDRPAGLERP